MEHCLCGKEATWRCYGAPRCDEHIEGMKRCFNVWPPVPGSLADGAIERIPAEPKPSKPLQTETFQFWQTKI